MSDMLQIKRQAYYVLLDALSDYLDKSGWTSIDCDGANMFQRIDPVTGQSHRNDFAFIIQSERDAAELEKKTP